MNHCLFGIDHAVVQIHVDNLRTVFRLHHADVYRFRKISFPNQIRKFPRSRDIQAFADIHKAAVRSHFQAVQARKQYMPGFWGYLPRTATIEDFRKMPNVFRRRSTAAADDIHQSLFRITANPLPHHLRRVVVTAELVRKSRIRMHGDSERRIPNVAQMRNHVLRSQSAIETDAENRIARKRMPKSLSRLARENPPRSVGNCSRNHNGEKFPPFIAHLLNGIQSRFGVQRIKNGFHQQNVGTTVQKTVHRHPIGVRKFLESHHPRRRIRYIRTHACRLGSRSQGTRDKTTFRRLARIQFFLFF